VEGQLPSEKGSEYARIFTGLAESIIVNCRDLKLQLQSVKSTNTGIAGPFDSQAQFPAGVQRD
jgi:hypothetical protein